MQHWPAVDAPPVIAAVVLAAGRAVRFGGPKQIATVGGKPLVQHAVEAAAGGGVDEIVVVVGARGDDVEAALSLPPNTRLVRNPDFAAGQSTSLRAGVGAVRPDAAAVMVLLADQPGVTADDVRAVADGFASSGAPVVRASYRGEPGHPILFARRLFDDLLAATGDEGAREVVRRHVPGIRDVAIDRDPPGDVDTAADLEALGGHPARDVSPPGHSG